MRRSRSWSAVAAGAVVGVVVSACAAIAVAVPAADRSAAGRRAPTATSSARPAPVGKLGGYQVGLRRITLVEPSHISTGGYRLPDRELATEIRYPLAAGSPGRPATGPLPLIVFGPGFMSCPAPYSALLRAWASAGYVVAAFDFPNSSCLAGAAATETDLVNQPQDMSHVISRLLAASAARHGLFSGLINPDQIAIAGHSDGGDTVAAIAANSCCSDHRVRAAISLSGAEWPAMHGQYFTGDSPPMLFVQGSADPVNWPACSADMYLADRSPNRYYLDALGLDHTQPYWEPNRARDAVIGVTTAFLNRWVLGQRPAAAAMTRAGNVAGVTALYSGGAGQFPGGPCDNNPGPGSG